MTMSATTSTLTRLFAGDSGAERFAGPA